MAHHQLWILPPLHHKTTATKQRKVMSTQTITPTADAVSPTPMYHCATSSVCPHSTPTTLSTRVIDETGRDSEGYEFEGHVFELPDELDGSSANHCPGWRYSRHVLPAKRDKSLQSVASLILVAFTEI
jgi:hypothetical protein